MDPVWPEYFQPSIVVDGKGYRLSAYTLALEAWRRDLTVTFIGSPPRRVRVSDPEGESVIFFSSRPGLKKSLIVQNKYKANQLLRAAGVPVPQSKLIEPDKVKAAELVQVANDLGYPVVLKPLDGSRGRGVFANITNAEALVARYTQLKKEYSTSLFVIERHVPGRDYRVLVYGKTYVAATLRIPANVIGNGVSTIRQLIDAKNAERARNPFLSTGPILLDGETEEFLARAGCTYESVPTDGRRIQLRGAANASAGGDTVDVTESLPFEIRQAAIDSVAAIPGLPCAGVDVLFDDEHPGENHQPGTYHVLELNGVPQIGVNMYPSSGTGIDVPKKIIDIYFPMSSRSKELGDRELAIALKPIREILAHGHAQEVTLAAIPPGRYSFRRVYDYPKHAKLSELGRTRLLRRALQLSIAGSILREEGRVRLRLAGNESDVIKFQELASKALGSGSDKGKRWFGRVCAGFEIDL